MEYKNLGFSGLQVSSVGLGCNNFGSGRVAGSGMDMRETRAVVEQCLEEGITFFDTADMYGDGTSEEFIGRILKPHRHDVVIATKISAAMGEGPYWQGASRRYVVDAVEASLRRLDMDYIDLLQIHYPDPSTPIEETISCLDDLVRAGKVRYIGSCNFYGWQLVNADWVSKTERLTHFISAQNEFNLLQRNVEVEIGPACEACGLGLLPYHPLASGFLTGKYRPNIAPPEGARLSKGSAGGTTLDEESFDQLLKLEAFATVCGHTVLELAFSWLAGKSFVASVIAGATSPEQVSANAKAAGWKLTIAEYAEVDRILDHIPTDPRRGGASARRHTG